ncbi:MAG: tol-pal system-associated acyl-CoA thioesterase [Myxococcales bacterium]|nr:tol-pal system-associated acyl-CoA thioesterase [Myxococcales bacterium]
MPTTADSNLELRVYLEDTDAGGIVYHASYLRFLERARTEWLRAMGLQQSQTFDDDVSFVVHSMKLRFLRPARLDEQLGVSCVPVTVRAASIVFEQRVNELESGELCCQAEVRVACIRLRSGRPRRIPEAIVRHALSQQGS